MRQTEKDEFGFDLRSHMEFTTGELHNTQYTKKEAIKRQFVNLIQHFFYSFVGNLQGFNRLI